MKRTRVRRSDPSIREQLKILGIIHESDKSQVKPDPQSGITTEPTPAKKVSTTPTVTKHGDGIAVKHWFWAAMDELGTEPAAKKSPAPVNAAPVPPAGDVQAEIGKILTEHPGISGPTLYNLLKSKGWTIAPPAVQEADASSANVAATRANETAAPGVDPKKFDDCVAKVSAKGSADNAYAVCNASLKQAGAAAINPLKKEAQKLHWDTFSKFRESTPRGGSSKGGFTFRCVLLKEGMGNFRDKYYYSADALKSAVPIFEGKKIYADHPSSVEENIRPERSVRDVLGHFENVAFEESGGTGALCADVSVMPDQPFEWARALMRRAVEFSKKFPDKDFIGLSINAGGDADEMPIESAVSKGLIPEGAMPKIKEAQAEGIDVLKWVSRITEAVSCDLVTEAGAGGRLLTMLESDQSKGDQMAKKKENEGKMKASEDEAKKKECEGAMKQEESGDEGAAAASGDGADGGEHSDEDQDKELITKMLNQYLGDPEHDEDTMKAAHQAYQTAMEAYGGDQKQALEAAGHTMKLARHMKMKQPQPGQSPADAHPGADAGHDAAAAHAAPAKQDEAKHSEDESHKESNEILRLRGENAKLREAAAQREMVEYLDKMLDDSKQSNKVTKAFRESLGSKIPKTKAELDAKFKLFMEGVKAAGMAEGFEDLIVQPEKAGEAASVADFSDCIN